MLAFAAATVGRQGGLVEPLACVFGWPQVTVGRSRQCGIVVVAGMWRGEQGASRGRGLTPLARDHAPLANGAPKGRWME